MYVRHGHETQHVLIRERKPKQKDRRSKKASEQHTGNLSLEQDEVKPSTASTESFDDKMAARAARFSLPVQAKSSTHTPGKSKATQESKPAQSFILPKPRAKGDPANEDAAKVSRLATQLANTNQPGHQGDNKNLKARRNNEAKTKGNNTDGKSHLTTHVGE